MPGYTANYQLPYMLGSEGLHTIDDVTKQLADRLDKLISTGALKGSAGEAGAPGGPNGPAAAVTLATAFSSASGTLYYTLGSAGTSAYDLRSAGGAQTYENGVICSKAGIYHLSITAPWGTNNTNGVRVLKLIDDASGNTLAEDVRPGSSIEQISHLSTVLPLAAGQKLTSYIFQNSGAALNVGGTQQGGIDTRFSMTWLGPSS